MTQGHTHDERRHDSRIHGNAAPVQSIRFDMSAATLIIVLALVLVIAGCGVVIGIDVSERASMGRKFDELTESFKELKTQNWLLERRLMDKEALDIIHGGKLPSDTEFGPTGNLQRMKPKEK